MARTKTIQPIEADPVGAAEIAKRLHVKPQTVHTWRHRKLIPVPCRTVSGQPAWDWAEIEKWVRQTGRLHDNNPYAQMLELEGVGWEENLNEIRADRMEEL